MKLKANNAPLFACVQAAFAVADAGGELAPYEESESGHDRQERRRASVIARPPDAPAFPDLAAIGRIEVEEKCCYAINYYVILSYYTIYDCGSVICGPSRLSRCL